MAEVVAGFYAVETLVEGAAAGALAVSGSTVPLHAKFQKIKSPSRACAVHNATANLVKNKIYLIGGESSGQDNEHAVHALSFPPDCGLSRTNGSQPVEIDYELQKPELTIAGRPLQHNVEDLERKASGTSNQSHALIWARTKHSAISIDDRIYVLGGVSSTTLDSRRSNTEALISLDKTLAYDTLKSSYSVLQAEPAKSTEGIPEPRYGASCTSSIYPPSASAVEGEGPTLEAHGTIFLHGGWGNSGLPFHDTWTFDLGTKAWHKFPSIVLEAVKDQSSPGQIVYVEGRLWYINGSTAMFLELAEHDPATNENMSQDPANLSTGRVGSGQWQVVYPPPSEDPAAISQKAENNEVDEKTPSTTSNVVPTEPTHQIIPITTGAGRNYLLTLSSKNPQSMYLFQIPSSSKTATSIKDAVRDRASSAISSLPDTWKSGKHEWSRVEVVQANKEGEIARPSENLQDFAAAAWSEYGDKFVLWGGQVGGQPQDEGWIIDLN